MMDFIIKIIEPYWQYLSIAIGLVLVYLGCKIMLDRKFLDKLMGKGRMWEHEEDSRLSKKEARQYNRSRGLRALLMGVIFIVFALASLYRSI